MIHALQVLSQWAGTRLDQLWMHHLGDTVPRARIQEWIRAGLATVDGRPCGKPSLRVSAGQRLTLEVPDPSPATVTPDPGPLSVLYADDHLVVIDKAPGLTTHPAPSVEGPTVVERAAAAFPALLTLGGERPGVVHRLDKDTSGLLVLALSEPARVGLSAVFSERRVHKEYLALVAGALHEPMRVDLPMDRHPTLKTRMAVVPHGRPALTEVWPLWQAPGGQAALVRVRIHTGRTHQIRVHLAAQKHPLLGDAVYAPGAIAAMAPRQMLHSWYLAFAHPITGQRLEFRAAPPQDFWDTLEALTHRTLRLGITGCPGCGKSTVTRMLAEAGVPTVSADAIVGQSYLPGAAGWEILRCHYGRRFTPSDDAPVDRQALAQAMEDPRLRREVESLIHPVVRAEVAAFWEAHRDAPVAAAEIPLLLESGMDEDCDLVLGVFCPDSLRHQRLAGRGWSPEHRSRMDSWQWPQAHKIRAAHLVVDNSGPLDDTLRRTLAALAVAMRLAQGRRQRLLHRLRHFLHHGVWPESPGSPHVSPS